MPWNAANLRDIIDNVSKNVKLILATIGDSTTADTVKYHIAQQQIRIDGIGDKDYEKYLELSCDKGLTELLPLPYMIYANLVKDLASAIEANQEHSLSDEWGEKLKTEQDATLKRIPCYFADMFKGQIAPNLVFPKENIELGSVAIVTSVDTYTDGNEIDTTKYGGAVLKVRVTVQMTTNPAIVTINGLDENGSKWEGTVTIAVDKTVGTEIDVTPSIAGTYCANVTDVVLTAPKPAAGGFKILSKEDRALTA